MRERVLRPDDFFTAAYPQAHRRGQIICFRSRYSRFEEASASQAGGPGWWQFEAGKSPRIPFPDSFRVARPLIHNLIFRIPQPYFRTVSEQSTPRHCCGPGDVERRRRQGPHSRNLCFLTKRKASGAVFTYSCLWERLWPSQRATFCRARSRCWS